MSEKPEEPTPREIDRMTDSEKIAFLLSENRQIRKIIDELEPVRDFNTTIRTGNRIVTALAKFFGALIALWVIFKSGGMVDVDLGQGGKGGL